ncbi:MAG: NAD(+)/NADH kinase [Candidatus Bathyarchaeota archaeon]|nr:MAG: NAD(+)/NADH kinase [Candidatus Bathyarchaeota archaeon]
MTFRSVGLTARNDKKAAFKLIMKLLSYLREKELDIVLDPGIGPHIDAEAATSPLEDWNVDFIITVGGDGTILRTCIQIPKPEPPILAINMGERGFLAEVAPECALKALKRCLNGTFIVETCKKLAVSVGNRQVPDALNEVFISAGAPVKLLYANLWKDGARILDVQADGVLVASPTGSTGYSLAAGGPVLDPETDVFVITPVCPLTPFPPIVFPESSILTVEIEKPNSPLVVVDGYYKETLQDPSQQEVVITRSRNTTSFIRFRKEFYGRLKSRLLYPKER